jgi:hypothetical protein
MATFIGDPPAKGANVRSPPRMVRGRKSIRASPQDTIIGTFPRLPRETGAQNLQRLTKCRKST